MLKQHQVLEPLLAVRLRVLAPQLGRQERRAPAVEVVVRDVLGEEGALGVRGRRQRAEALVLLDCVVCGRERCGVSLGTLRLLVSTDENGDDKGR